MCVCVRACVCVCVRACVWVGVQGYAMIWNQERMKRLMKEALGTDIQQDKAEELPPPRPLLKKSVSVSEPFYIAPTADQGESRERDSVWKSQATKLHSTPDCQCSTQWIARIARTRLIT